MNGDVSVYVFSSKNITNIWAGYGAGLWAVAIGSESGNKGKVTKAAKMPVGSFGILYCEPWKAFTVPFVTSSDPDKERVEAEVWEHQWMLPFSFHPLGSPRRRFDADKILRLPGAVEKGIGAFSNYLTVQGNFAFQPSRVDGRDWQEILRELI